MRTTITLDPDVAALVKRAMAQRDQRFKDVINDGLRRGLAKPVRSQYRYRLKPFDMGEPRVPLVKALQLAGQLEDAYILEKMRQGR
jgi:hypothetical protein